MEQVQKQRQKPTTKQDQVEELPAKGRTPEAQQKLDDSVVLLDEIDIVLLEELDLVLLEEIDEALQGLDLDFAITYTQKGGQ